MASIHQYYQLKKVYIIRGSLSIVRNKIISILNDFSSLDTIDFLYLLENIKYKNGLIIKLNNSFLAKYILNYTFANLQLIIGVRCHMKV